MPQYMGRIGKRRFNPDGRKGVSRTAILQQRISWQGIESWYAWHSFDAWLEQHRRIQLLKDLVPLCPLAEQKHNLSPNSETFSKTSTYELHEIIKIHIMRYPEAVDLPEERNFHVLEEPECLDRRRKLVCAPDLVFIYSAEEVYLVEIKSSDDEEGVREQLIRGSHYFEQRFSIDCRRIGVYVQSERIQFFCEPEVYVVSDDFK